MNFEPSSSPDGSITAGHIFIPSGFSDGGYTRANNKLQGGQGWMFAASRKTVWDVVDRRSLQMERRGTDSTERTVGPAHLTGAAIPLQSLVTYECCMTEHAI